LIVERYAEENRIFIKLKFFKPFKKTIKAKKRAVIIKKRKKRGIKKRKAGVILKIKYKMAEKATIKRLNNRIATKLSATSWKVFFNKKIS